MNRSEFQISTKAPKFFITYIKRTQSGKADVYFSVVAMELDGEFQI